MKVRQLCLAAAFSIAIKTAADPLHIPIQAKLVRALQAGRVKVGDPVLAKVQVAWQSTDCSLREGAIVRGHVVSQVPRSKMTKTSEIALSFDSAECDGAMMKPLSLTLAALVARDNRRDSNGYESMALSSSLGALQHGALDRRDPGHDQFKSSQALLTRVTEPMHKQEPGALSPGAVVGIEGVKLSVASGPDGSSVISSTKYNLDLEAATQIVLVKNAKVFAPAKVAESIPVPKALQAEPVIDETEVCTPPACNLALTTDAPESAHSTISLPVKNLGFPAPPTHEMSRFDHEAAIVYLGDSQLLLTFNPHTLVPRPELEGEARTTRLIRGALIDLSTSKVKKIVEWRLPDDEQYLWPLGAHMVLVHAGRELKLYGPGLKLERSLALDGPLAFVRPSPSGSYIAIGVRHERHSEEVHRQLREAEDQEPEEDVKVRVLDSTFKTVIDVNRSSRARPPVLLEDGEVQSLSAGGVRWRIVDTNWKGEQRILAKLTSACRPQTTSLPPDLLFVVGCDIEAYGRWYRVLGNTGKPVLKGKSPSDELEQSSSGSSSGANFAVSITKVSRSRMANDIFHASELKSQSIGVYAIENGRRVLSVNVASPLPTLQTFALSSDGSQLAVLQGDHISLYPLH